MDHASWLVNLGLPSLKYHHVYFDLVMCYQIVRKLVDVDVSELFTVSVIIHSTEETLASYRQFLYLTKIFNYIV